MRKRCLSLLARWRRAAAALCRRCPHENVIATEHEWCAFAHRRLCLDCGLVEHALSSNDPAVMGPDDVSLRPRRIFAKPREVSNKTFSDSAARLQECGQT